MATVTSNLDTPLGPMLAASRDNRLAGLWFVDQKHYPPAALLWAKQPQLPLFADLRDQLANYFTGRLRTFELPLAPVGTPFREQIWQLLSAVTYGTTVSYAWLAAQHCGPTRGKTMARAVGGAVGHNPISIVIPCHRVVGADGRLTGYAGGLARKEALLALELDGRPLL